MNTVEPADSNTVVYPFVVGDGGLVFAEKVLAAGTPMAQTLNFAYCFVSHPAWVIGHVHQAEGPVCTPF